jgi:hypothetical protein
MLFFAHTAQKLVDLGFGCKEELEILELGALSSAIAWRDEREWLLLLKTKQDRGREFCDLFDIGRCVTQHLIGVVGMQGDA